MIKVKVVYMNGKESQYDVEYPKAYIAKIMESENDLMPERKAVKEIYAGPKLIAEFIGSELRLVEPKPKKTAGMGRYKGHTVPAGYDDGIVFKKDYDEDDTDVDPPNEKLIQATEEYMTNISVKYTVDEAIKLGKDIKDQIKADEDWNEYQAEILHAQKMLKENAWVVDHTGGNIQITYS